MNRRVFVSSTFADLKAYRNAVESAIRRLGGIDVAMEHFGAQDSYPKDECVRLLKEETDVYVGIFAYRYGFVPAGEQQSLTEIEYRTASEVHLPRLIYLVDESAPWLPSDIEKGAGAEGLSVLKAYLLHTHICARFSTPDNLAAGVASDLGRLFSSADAFAARSQSVPELDALREQRLISELQSGNQLNVEKAIDVISHSSSPSALEALHRLVLSGNDETARRAIDALRKISGPGSAEILAEGLTAPNRGVRFWTAYTLGEMALFGRRNDSRLFVERLISVLLQHADDANTLGEIVHSIAKIGGPKAYEALIGIVEARDVPSHLRAMALHGPGRFWARSPGPGDRELYNRFVERACTAIRSWPVETCRSVRDDSIFKYVDDQLQRAVHLGA